ncbi:hypothetical protein J4E86_010380 [Alternaria arbusti]|uniref:uncharacterized protein n=1 Tax=Alternaria arbusti TaxID=232088 RepID=UPI0022209CC2|nr:uncharacterized protein J4E86_010380 [Alternaria arbusti]KAI4941869.1 hypothetical protein J4E86_010380 [Alternaria arbusti]
MEGVAAFSLACNVIQIAELSRKIIATAKEIQTSRNGLPKDHEDLRAAVEILRRDVADLQQNYNGDILQSLAVQSEVAINEHIALLDSLRLKGPRTFLRASAVAFKAWRKQRQLYESQAKVDQLSEELKTHIVTTRIPNIDRNVDYLGDKLASHNLSIDHDMKIIEQHLNRVYKANRQCLYALYFPEIRSRADQVKRAHEDTFGWIFDGAGDLSESIHKSKFKKWLRLDDPSRNVFWVYGKPGAGKSTLIKALKECPQLVPKVFPRREWTHAGTDFRFPQDILWSSFQDLLNLAPSFNIFLLFIIDGLDEFDDRVEVLNSSAPDVQDLLRLLRAIQACPSAKLCVASLPLNEFEIHLGKDRDFCIPVHDLTSRDIRTYTEDTLSKHPAFAQLVLQDSGYANLIADITSAAEGVFLRILDAPSLQQFMNGEDMVLFAATVRRRFHARSRGLLEFRARWDHQSDEFRGVQHEMSKLRNECVGLAHRSMAELLDRNDMRHQITTEAGMAFEMPELYAQALMATLKAEVSIAWTLRSIQDSGIHFGKKDSNDVERNIRALLHKLVPIMEQAEEEQMKAHWSKLDDFLNFPLAQEMNL